MNFLNGVPQFAISIGYEENSEIKCGVIFNPILKHIVYEWIHHFCDGNGRSGRILLLNDLDYNFSKVNQVNKLINKFR